MLASGKYSGFTQRELEIVLNRVERDRGDAKADKLTKDKVLRHAADWKLWVYGFMFLCCSAPIYAFAYFIQIILTTMGYETSTVFLLCAPPYLFSIFWTVGIAWLADRTRMRMPYMVFNAAVTLTGLLVTAYSSVGGKNSAVQEIHTDRHRRIKALATLEYSLVYPVATGICRQSWHSKQIT
jgi:hypothetical protein